VTFIYYYLTAYYLNRIFKREIIGSAPAFRKKPINLRIAFSSKLMPFYVVLLLIIVTVPYSRSFLKDNVHDTIRTINRVRTEFRK
jgi:hypothetical protein